MSETVSEDVAVLAEADEVENVADDREASDTDESPVETVEYEADLRYPSGTRAMHIVYTPWRERDGAVSGWIATLLDSCVGCAVHSALPAGKGYTTLELKVNYVRAVLSDTGPVRAEGRVIHLGGRVATAEGRLVDAGGKLYAHCSTTCLVMELGKK